MPRRRPFPAADSRGGSTSLPVGLIFHVSEKDNNMSSVHKGCDTIIQRRRKRFNSADLEMEKTQKNDIARGKIEDTKLQE